MGDAAPGWYEDDEDGRLARWWDGRTWTRHTIVIADQVPGVEPLPPGGATRFPVPPPPDEWLDDPSFAEGAAPVEFGFEDEGYDTEAFDDAYADEYEDDALGEPSTEPGFQAWPTIRVEDDGGWRRLDPADDRGFRPPHTSRRERARFSDDDITLGDRVRELPTWLRVVAPVVAVLVALGAVASAGALRSDDDGAGVDTTDEPVADPARLRDAADTALEIAGVSWFTRQGFVQSIPPTCVAAVEDDPQRVADRIILLGYDDPTVGHLVDGLEAGTLAYCPDEIAERPGFFEDIFLATGAEAAATSTTTTSPDVPAPTTITAATTRATTPTTRKAAVTTKPAPTTTLPPPTTTTVAPTTTTVAPATTTTACPGPPCE